jgi:murein DD-endopeptidase MepM/ murein hydrolase activator NlpD
MRLKKFFLLLSSVLTVFFVEAQLDSLKLECPLTSGVPRIIRASDKDYQKSSEYGVMFTSKTDTAVLAVHDAQVVIVARTEDSKFDMVLQFKGYYFWYAGIVSPKIKTGSRVKAGDVIGNYKPGDLIELLMYLQEEPVNPRKYLKCK